MKIRTCVVQGLVVGVALAPAMSAPAFASARKYRNCDALNRSYPHGVARPGARDKTSGRPVTTFRVNRAVYRKNTHLDRDKDGIACEKR